MMDGGRYDRQLNLKEFGSTAQEKLKNAKVLVVGAGGLGVPVLTYLNAMGVGTLGIVDNDAVSLSNLHRQVAYAEADIGNPKVDMIIEALGRQNSTTLFIPYKTFLSPSNAADIIKDYDVVVDATDNFPTRYLINDVCVVMDKPLVYGALHAFEGQVSVFNYQNGPTYRCLYPIMPKADEVPNCNENGVLGVLPGIIGNLQALETVKVLTGIGEVLAGHLLLFDGLNHVFQKIRIKKNPKIVLETRIQKDYRFDCDFALPSVDVDTFLALHQKQRRQLIDVRTQKEYDDRHLDEVIHIPLDQLGADTLGSVDISKPIYFICQSGARSKKAILKLKKQFPKAMLINVAGGMGQIVGV